MQNVCYIGMPVGGGLDESVKSIIQILNEPIDSMREKLNHSLKTFHQNH